MNKMYSNQINKIQLGSKSEQKKQNREVQRGVKGAAMIRDLGRKTESQQNGSFFNIKGQSTSSLLVV